GGRDAAATRLRRTRIIRVAPARNGAVQSNLEKHARSDRLKVFADRNKAFHRVLAEYPNLARLKGCKSHFLFFRFFRVCANQVEQANENGT
ncbi:hypothetical protein, partial [Paraburkholderia sp.]|uniref:hypothetical protein n=1 Tax=Paraburkholderia sp. TaxID=1926495 RepID=UPI0025CF0B1D